MFCLDSGQPRCRRALEPHIRGPRGRNRRKERRADQRSRQGERSWAEPPQGSALPSSGPLGRHRFSGGRGQKRCLAPVCPAFHFYCVSSPPLPLLLSVSVLCCLQRLTNRPAHLHDSQSSLHLPPRGRRAGAPSSLWHSAPRPPSFTLLLISRASRQEHRFPPPPPPLYSLLTFSCTSSSSLFPPDSHSSCDHNL